MRSVSQAIKWLESHLPVWAKILTAVVTILMFLTGAVGVAAGIMEIRPDIRELQSYQRTAEPVMYFLVCRAFERDAGRTTGACTFILREHGLYDDFRARGIIPPGS